MFQRIGRATPTLLSALARSHEPGMLGELRRGRPTPPSATQCRGQLVLHTLPIGVFGLDLLLDRGPFGLESFGTLFMRPLRLFQGGLRLSDQLIALGAFLFPRHLALAPLGIPPLLFALKLGGGLL
jgi:hypothetical protein